MAASDAKPVPLKNAAFRVSFDIENVTNGALITTWADMDSTISKDGEDYAACTNEATEIQTSGTGFLDLTADEMNADTVIVKVAVSNANARVVRLYFQPVESTDIPVNTVAFSNDTVAADNAESFFDGTGYAGTGNVIPTVTTVTNYTTPPTPEAIRTEMDSNSTQLTAIYDDLTVASGYALNAQIYAQGARDRFGPGITTSVTLDEWLTAMAAAGASVPLALTNAGFVASTDSLQAFRDGVAQFVWEYVTRTLTSGGGATVQNIFEADPADYDDDADSFAARFLAVKTKTDQFTGTVTYTGPVATDGDATVYQTSDYSATTQTISFTSDTTMALTGTPTWYFNGNTFTGTLGGSSGAWTLAFTLTAAQTAALKVGVYTHHVKVLLSGGELTPALIEGRVTVERHLGA